MACWVIATLLLTGLTLWFFVGTDRFEYQGRSLVTTPANWHFRGDVSVLPDGGFQLRNQNPTQSNSLFYELEVPPSRLLLLSADVVITDVQHGPKFWQLARIDLEGESKENPGKWEWMPGTKLLAEVGTGSFEAARVLQIPAGFKRIRISGDLSGATGVMTIHNLAAVAAEEKESFATYRQWLALTWTLFTLIAIVMLWRNHFRLELVATLSGGTILFLTPGWARAWVEPLNERAHFSVEHSLLFLLLTLALLFVSRHRLQPGILLGYLACLALATETAQWFVPGRGPELVDFFSNLIGILTAFSLWLSRPRIGR